MKNIIPLFIVAIVSSALSAQKVPLKSVVEHFTNTKCSVCASRNPGFIANKNRFPSLFYISIHPSAPYVSCVLSQQNTIVNDQRTNFYGVYGATPRLVINSHVINSSYDYSDSNLLKPYLLLQSSFDIQMRITRTKMDSMTYQVGIYKVDTSSIDSAYLFSGNIEDTVFINGGNGEPRHYNVVRYAVLEKVKLPSLLNDSIIIKKSVKLNSIWDEKRISSFAILQSTISKELIQTGSTGILPKFSGGSSQILISSKLSQNCFYPNPASSVIHMEGKELLTSIYDVLGQQVIVSTDTDIDVSSLSIGVYQIAIKNKEGEILARERLVVQR